MGWTYTNMLVIIVSTGSALLLLNLMVIICFCTLRKRGVANEAPPPHQQHATLPRIDSAATATTLTSQPLPPPPPLPPKFNVEEEKLVAGKQLLVEVNGSGDGRRMTSSSAESVGSVIDLTRMRLNHQSHVTRSFDPCRPAISLSDLVPQPPIGTPQENGYFQRNSGSVRSMGSTSSSIRREQQHHPTRSSASLHEITV